MMPLHPDAINALIHADHGAPFDILGPHATENETIIRAFRPGAETLEVLLPKGKPHPMTRIHESGLFEVTLPDAPSPLTYRLQERRYNGDEQIFDDPYRFPLWMTEYDLYLFGEGNFLYSYDKFGAHPRVVDEVAGYHFIVWAPNARRVSVVGSFNDWDARVHPMRKHLSSGLWELFIPHVQDGAIYRYDIRSQHMGYQNQKTDPYGFYSEIRPANASITFDIDTYTWQDEEWLTKRAVEPLVDRPLSIYEVHLGSWKLKEDGSWYTYRELAHLLTEYVLQHGFTHVELMPVAEHPLDLSWGYQTVGYYAPTSRFGTPTDFMYFVDYLHQHNIGVILDWVPAHFPKDGHGLSYFDGTKLYEHEDPRQGEHPDWGTLIFNYGRNEVRNFLISNALYWLKKYHIDGLRVDAVSSMLYLNYSRNDGEWLPNKYGGHENLEAIDFIRSFNEIVHREVPGAITIAEESTSWPMVSRPTQAGGLGFTFKWNMGWMHDTLDYMSIDPLYRRYHHNELTFSLMYAFTENFVLSISHDEVVHGKGSLLTKMSGADDWQKFSTLRLLFGYQMTHPGKKLIFMGQEFGQRQEWSEARSLEWEALSYPYHQKTSDWVRDLNKLYQAQPALYEVDFDYRGFRWLIVDDAEHSIFAFIRFAQDTQDFLVVIANFTPQPYYHYRIGVPSEGVYREVLNSDSEYYGGSNIGNLSAITSEPTPSHELNHSINITVPPLAIMIFKLDA